MPNIVGASGKIVGTEAVPAAFAESKIGAHTIFRAVFREAANPRAGTASTKRRDEVSGGGRKPWKQKGTGRARQGSTRSPQWRHGGVVFGPKPRSYKVSLNKKERKAAFVAALAARYAADAVFLLDPAAIASAKTKDFAIGLFGSRKEADHGPSTLVVYAPAESGELGRSIVLGARNLRQVRTASADALDVTEVLSAKRIYLTASASTYLQQMGASA